MPAITTKDGVEIFYKDWGSGQPIVFSHGWPLSSDDWDAQMLFCWRQGMMGSAKAHYDGIKAFPETDQTEDLKAITVPTLMLHGEDDQIVPIDDGARLSAPLLKNGTLKTYPGYGHGLLTVNTDVLNADLLAFLQA